MHVRVLTGWVSRWLLDEDVVGRRMLVPSLKILLLEDQQMVLADLNVP